MNVLNLVLVGSHYGERVDAAQMSNIDVNSDGIVDVRDLVIVANVMGRGDIAPTGGTLIFGRGGDSLCTAIGNLDHCLNQDCDTMTIRLKGDSDGKTKKIHRPI